MSRAVARLALFACILLVCLVALSPNTRSLPSTGWDKLNHMLAFTTLGLAAWWAYPTARWQGLSALLAFGVLIELVQAQIPGRSAEAGDVLADLLGLAAAVLAARLMGRRAAGAGSSGP